MRLHAKGPEHDEASEERQLGGGVRRTGPRRAEKRQRRGCSDDSSRCLGSHKAQARAAQLQQLPDCRLPSLLPLSLSLSSLVQDAYKAHTRRLSPRSRSSSTSCSSQHARRKVQRPAHESALPSLSTSRPSSLSPSSLSLSPFLSLSLSLPLPLSFSVMVAVLDVLAWVAGIAGFAVLTIGLGTPALSRPAFLPRAPPSPSLRPPLSVSACARAATSSFVPLPASSSPVAMSLSMRSTSSLARHDPLARPRSLRPTPLSSPDPALLARPLSLRPTPLPPPYRVRPLSIPAFSSSSTSRSCTFACSFCTLPSSATDPRRAQMLMSAWCVRARAPLCSGESVLPRGARGGVHGHDTQDHPNHHLCTKQPCRVCACTQAAPHPPPSSRALVPVAAAGRWMTLGRDRVPCRAAPAGRVPVAANPGGARGPRRLPRPPQRVPVHPPHQPRLHRQLWYAVAAPSSRTIPPIPAPSSASTALSASPAPHPRPVVLIAVVLIAVVLIAASPAPLSFPALCAQC